MDVRDELRRLTTGAILNTALAFLVFFLSVSGRCIDRLSVTLRSLSLYRSFKATEWRLFLSFFSSFHQSTPNCSVRSIFVNRKSCHYRETEKGRIRIMTHCQIVCFQKCSSVQIFPTTQVFLYFSSQHSYFSILCVYLIRIY